MGSIINEYCAVVHYWSSNRVRRHTDGHLAMQLRGHCFQGDSEFNSCFVNWAPKSGVQGVGSGRLNTRGPGNVFMWNVHDLNRFDFHADCGAMGGKPEFTVKIGALQENKFGLDLGAMYDWWQVFSHAANTNWSLAKRNCSSVVAKCLIVGGAKAYVSAPLFPIWTPKSVFEWSENLKAKIDALNDMARRIENTKNFKRDFRYDNLPPWTVEEWKKRSDAGRFARRYESLRKIDHALELFHGIHIDVDDRETLIRKEKAAVEVLQLIHEQMVARPDSKRMDSIIALGQQVLQYKNQLNDAIARINRRLAKLAAQDAPELDEIRRNSLDDLRRDSYYD